MSLMLIATRHAAGCPPQHNDSPRAAANMASVYVPVESWVYTAFESLADKGYIQSAFFDLRPWTRLDCARLIEEAEDLTADQQIDPATLQALRDLKREFAPELARRAGAANAELLVDSAYQRVTAISGRPLTDGYHFAETFVNDEGRPFGEGANLYSGMSVRASAVSIAAYVEIEGERSGSAVAPNVSAQPQIAAIDFTPAAQDGPAADFLRGRVLDAYVSFGFANNQFTFGQQTLWWGPARSSATLFSNNADPIMMLRYDRLLPVVLPGPLRLLGLIRAQLLLGRLSGTQYAHTDQMTFGSPGHSLQNQPWIHGEKFSFEPTPNFQFGISRTVLFAGQGVPFTAHTLLRSIFSAGTGNEQNDPGDRRVAFDARYRIPGMRSCLVGYVDTFTEDEPFPLAYPRRSVWIPGFDLRCLPHSPRLTFRAEGLVSPHRDEFPGYYYFNVHYLSGYTNDRQLIGSWIGREGQGEQLWATWQLSPRSSVEVSGRNMTNGGEFLRGGSLRDLRATADLSIRPDWQLHLDAQTEWWHFPLLLSGKQHDNSVTVQLTYRPLRGRDK